jgi:hypothetical protein
MAFKKKSGTGTQRATSKGGSPVVNLRLFKFGGGCGPAGPAAATACVRLGLGGRDHGPSGSESEP